MGVTTKILVHWGGGGRSEIKILKANGEANEKRMCLKEQQIDLSNCLEFTCDFMLKNINVCKVRRSYSLELDVTVRIKFLLF